MKQKISLAFQREAFCQRINVLKTLFQRPNQERLGSKQIDPEAEIWCSQF